MRGAGETRDRAPTAPRRQLSSQSEAKQNALLKQLQGRLPFPNQPLVVNQTEVAATNVTPATRNPSTNQNQLGIDSTTPIFPLALDTRKAPKPTTCCRISNRP
uniref:Uncharacterized protein n=1 Tax=Grammatophora oceanica TaxID=210454 RepID=A0A7S1Y690_9STRA|mmetsp:Transcript_25339/g.37021  ORF Transcript_25339/g.37021 Transcript_25339/m.37021 type:complete len:103 (+) Transcript_25339:245-553(+)